MADTLARDNAVRQENSAIRNTILLFETRVVARGDDAITDDDPDGSRDGGVRSTQITMGGAPAPGRTLRT